MRIAAEAPAADARAGRTRNGLLAVLTILAVIAALKVSAPITLPLLIAVFLIILVWPLEVALERRLPRWLAFLGTVLVVLLASALIAGAFVWSMNRLVEMAPDLTLRLEALLADAVGWARAHRLPVPRGAQAMPLSERLGELVGALIPKVYGAAAATGLLVAFLLLGLLEVRDFEMKIERRLRRRMGDALLDTSAKIATKVRQHLLALTITSAISGTATGLFAYGAGLEPALMWGLVTFLLNYIPTLGPMVAVFPPTFFALLQFEGIVRPLVVFLGIGAIQFFTGNFLDPKIEGRVLSLSPFVVLFAIVFWAWVWGVPGAFLAVPLTAAVVIVCRQFESTRWMAALMTGVEEEVEEENHPRAKKGARA